MKLTSAVFPLAIIVCSTVTINLERYAASGLLVTRQVREAASENCSVTVATDVVINMLNKTCCKSWDTVNLFKDKKVYDDCVEEINKKVKVDINDDLLNMNSIPCSKYELIKMKFACTEECIAVKSKLFKEDGSPEPENIRAFVKENIYTDTWMQLLDRLINATIPAGNNTKETSLLTGDLKCSVVPFTMKHLLWIFNLANCPEADIINDLPYCAKIQDGLKRFKDNLPK